MSGWLGVYVQLMPCAGTLFLAPHDAGLSAVTPLSAPRLQQGHPVFTHGCVSCDQPTVASCITRTLLPIVQLVLAHLLAEHQPSVVHNCARVPDHQYPGDSLNYQPMDLACHVHHHQLQRQKLLQLQLL